MKIKIDGSFEVRNILRVYASAVEIGEMHIHRRSGWRGGPSYQFHPNAEGTARWLKPISGKTVSDLKRQIETTISKAPL